MNFVEELRWRGMLQDIMPGTEELLSKEQVTAYLGYLFASGIIYGLAFFLFFSGILRKHVPLIAISLLITFLYGGLVWNMFPQFAKATTSWEGHLSGAIAGTLCAIGFMEYGPQRPDPFAGEEDEEEDEDEENNEDEDDKKEEEKDEDSSTRIE